MFHGIKDKWWTRKIVKQANAWKGRLKKSWWLSMSMEIIDILQITNRRFMYNPQTGTLILGDEIYGKTICSSHSQEFHASRAEGCFDDYLRGWIGTSKSYPHGIIHFAPAVIMEQFDRGFDALQMFAGLEGVNGDTIVRGFCTLPEQRMGDLLHSSLWDTGSDKISYDKVSCLWQHRRWRARYPFVNYRNSVGRFSFYTSSLFLCSYTWAKPLPFISIICITSTVSSLPSPSDFSDAKVGAALDPAAWSVFPANSSFYEE